MSVRIPAVIRPATFTANWRLAPPTAASPSGWEMKAVSSRSLRL